MKKHIPNLLTLGNLYCGYLSISYIISGYFILALQLMMQEEIQRKESLPVSAPQHTAHTIDDEKMKFFLASLPDLTSTEQLIYNAYLAGKTSREIMEEQNIKENTLKYHNKNIYSKLGVSSRKEMLEIQKAIKLKKNA